MHPIADFTDTFLYVSQCISPFFLHNHTYTLEDLFDGRATATKQMQYMHHQTYSPYIKAISVAKPI